jgi:predicted nucleic acid-binding protein
LTQGPIVVAVNASPLIGLVKGRRLSLLRLLYDAVLIPSLVYDDAGVKGHRRAGARAVRNAVTAGWLQVVAVSDASVVPAEFRSTGEGEVIALARMKKADYVIIDDRKARHYCDRVGVKWISTGGVIRDAMRARRVRKAKPIFEQMMAKGFGIFDYEAILQELGELP